MPWLDLQGSDRNRITHSQANISLGEDSDDNVVEHNDAGGEGGGVDLTYGSDHNVVRYNTICGGIGDPMYVTDASHNLIEHNFVPACMGLSGTGMSITGTGTGNRLVNNLVIGDGLPHDPEFGPPGRRHPSAEPRDVPVGQHHQQPRGLRDQRRRGCRVGHQLRASQRA